MKRKLGALENDRQLFDDLLGTIKTTKTTQIEPLLTIIRNGGSRHDIRTYLDHHLRVDANSMQTEQGVADRHKAIRRTMRGRIQDVVNPPISVPAKPWTTVTDDDDFVSHLISLWFTWAHPWWHWVDEKLFLEAMRSGDERGLICTPSLVNMILADACLLDTLSADGSEPNKWIREQFYEEARRGLEAEKGRVSMAVVATLGVQWTYLNTSGQDSLGNTVLYQQIFLSKDLDRWLQKIHRSMDLPKWYFDNVTKCLDRLQWTLYALNSCTLLNFEKSQYIRPPSRPKPESNHDKCDNIDWTPYPQHHPPVSFHPACHYRSFVSLTELTARGESLVTIETKEDVDSAMRQLGELYTRIQNWSKTLPDCLLLDERCSPHVIALHALHNWVMVMMAKQIAAVESGNHSRPLLIRTRSPGEQPKWKEISLTCSIRIAELLEQIRVQWGADHFPVIIMHPVAIAVFPLLESLHETPEAPRAFFNLCLTIRAASRRFPVGKGLLLAVKQLADRRGIQLPENCRACFSDLSAVSASQNTSDLTDKGLDYLLDKWVDLDLQGC
ncbi:hypothetical protein PV08_06279 [Exophiala spinifera]|uniref:Transcription factor domain-containing protein n=1 Tax=Exophiala spinifera TaxID=91928 RepID=A0A0D2BB41_9EURO|nr:uncharacterized protein PV08_06279 [Exophiala spinifera]KIW16228.1 hypothetical protein PV08_06279 [Exophiala spinifera]